MKSICIRGKQLTAALMLTAMLLIMAGCACGDPGNDGTSAGESGTQGMDTQESGTQGTGTQGSGMQGTGADETSRQETEEIGTSSTDGVNQMTDPELGSSADAIEGGTADQMYAPGTYTGSAQGYGGTIEVTIEVDETSILSVKAEGKDETENVGQAALKQLEQQIMEANGTAVEAISGATYSSQGMFEAVEDALAQAYVYAEE